MRWSLPISVLMHLAILIAAMVALPRPEAFRVPPQEALPVEIVDISEVSKRVTMRKEAPDKPVKKPAPPKVDRTPQPKPQPKPQPRPQPKPEPKPQSKPQPKPAPKAEPAPLPDADALKQLVKKVAEPEPKPEPKPAPKKAEATPAQQARPAPRPRVRPRQIRRLAALRQKQKQKVQEAQKTRKTPKTPKNSADPIDEIAALLNKIDDKPQATEARAERTGRPMRGPADINGDDAQLAADIIDALRQRVESCWNVPVGVRDAEGLRVRVRFQLSPDGMVSGGPVVLNRMNHPAFEAAAGSAVRAVLACQPYDFLPPDRYDLWKDVILNFDPARMLRLN